GYLRGVWGRDSSNVWAVGDAGAIDFWNGTSWSACTPAAAGLSAVTGSMTMVWAVGNSGTVLHTN
ncbi:MAG: hypothetical protein ACHQ53_05660, partial [Polyangiales bacterium]